MCDPAEHWDGKDATSKLRSLLAKHLLPAGMLLGTEQVREMIRKDWSKLCALAHAVHDEETSEQKKLEYAARCLSNMDQEQFLDAVKGVGPSDRIEHAKLVARAILKK